MNNVLLTVIAAVLLATPFHALAQDSAPARPNVTAPPESPTRSSDPSIGRWVGVWDSQGRSAGSMEMDVDITGDQVTGQVRSTGSPGCSLEWATLTGVRKGDKVVAQYNLGGRCGKVDIIYAIDREGKVMTGTWSSEYPGYGAFRLTR